MFITRRNIHANQDVDMKQWGKRVCQEMDKIRGVPKGWRITSQKTRICVYCGSLHANSSRKPQWRCYQGGAKWSLWAR